MEDSYSFSRQASSGVWRSLRDGDFEEEDIWAVLKERKDSTSKVGESIESRAANVRRHHPSVARMIPRTLSAINNSTNIDSSCSCSSHETHGVKQQSAPVNIPDWSKISRKNTRKGSSHDDNDDGDDDYGCHDYHHDDDDDEDDDDKDDDGIVNGFADNDDDDEEFNSKMPPHEFLARRLARSQISSFSVFEGVGRKLKGRDLKKVRNAVLTRTGFLD